MYLLFKKRCLKMFRFKRGALNFCFNKVKILYLLICQNWALSTVFILFGIATKPKKGQRVCSASVKHPENEAHRFSDCLQRI